MPSLPEPAVSVRGVTVRYGARVALCEVTFSVEAGRLLAIVGANGAGKSTLFRAMVGLKATDEGEIRVLGHPAGELPEGVRRRIAYVPEAHPELASARVVDVVALRRAMYPGFDEGLFRGLASTVKLGPSTRFGELSRGQRALVVVSLALAQRPALLLLDDPSLGLDPLARRRLVQALLQVTRGREVTIVVATHEIADVERMADDLLLLSGGRVASQREEVDHFVARCASIRVPLGDDLDELRRVDGVLHVWPRTDHAEVILLGDEDDRRLACDTISVLLGLDLRQRPVSLEEATLAWLARDSEGGPHD